MYLFGIVNHANLIGLSPEALVKPGYVFVHRAVEIQYGLFFSMLFNELIQEEEHRFAVGIHHIAAGEPKQVSVVVAHEYGICNCVSVFGAYTVDLQAIKFF